MRNNGGTTTILAASSSRILVNDRASLRSAPMEVRRVNILSRHISMGFAFGIRKSLWRKRYWIVDHATSDIVATIGGHREKVRTLKAFERCFQLSPKEIRQLAIAAFAHKHLHHLMTLTSQTLLERQGLGKVTTSFALNNENKPHQSEFRSFRKCTPPI